MGRVALIFPGQGSQMVGMGQEFFETTAAGRELFERADALLGFGLSTLCFEGPRAALTRTENAQPAIFTVSLIAARLLEERGLRPAAVAGHSLGEYSALVAADVMSFTDGLRTVRRRGELMAQIGDRVTGAMAAILSLPVSAVEEIRDEASEIGIVEVANYNSPEETVITGERAAVERAITLATERGARRAVRLNVAAPFHSSLMAPVAEELAKVLAAVEMLPPPISVVANVTADYVRTPDAIRDALIRQVTGTVRWADSIRRLAEDGIETTVEAGPGWVLTGLTPQIVAGMNALNTEEALEREWPK